MTFDEWMSELKRIAVEKYDFAPEVQFCAVSWRTYFDAGEDPESALLEDMSYA